MAADLMGGTRRYTVLRGIIALILGLVALAFPEGVVGFFAYFIGFIAIIFSASVLMSGVGMGGRDSNWILIVIGVLGIIVGILILLSPTVFIVALVYLISMGLFIVGFGDLFTGLTTSEYGGSRWLLVLIGIISIIVSGILLFNPLFATILVVQIIGAYAIIIGILSIILGFLSRRT
jgi:uncharacterized membrane protein HdeD (DUF308 family)